LTGSRLVSVPFADHCQPLLSDSNQLETLLPLLRSCYDRDHWRYFELRPLILSSGLSRDTGLSRSESFYYHSLDLRPELDLLIRVVRKEGRPIASILTLQYKKKLVYKYGCSDARFHDLGGMAFLFWQAIQQAKNSDLEEFDLGRSDCGNQGLIDFKNHLGAKS